MNHHYSDIIDRIPEPPLWWDENAVPRYCEFSPNEVANIYADEACLLHIECQGCGAAFKVAFSRGKNEVFRIAHDYLHVTRKGEVISTEEIVKEAENCTLEAAVRSQKIHYGDPPNVGCCPAGATMNSVPRQVLEFWARGRGENGATVERNGVKVVKDPLAYMTWRRVPELEHAIEPDWWESKPALVDDLVVTAEDNDD